MYPKMLSTKQLGKEAAKLEWTCVTTVLQTFFVPRWISICFLIFVNVEGNLSSKYCSSVTIISRFVVSLAFVWQLLKQLYWAIWWFCNYFTFFYIKNGGQRHHCLNLLYEIEILRKNHNLGGLKCFLFSINPNPSKTFMISAFT